jgi:hypothetical protein
LHAQHDLSVHPEIFPYLPKLSRTPARSSSKGPGEVAHEGLLVLAKAFSFVQLLDPLDALLGKGLAVDRVLILLLLLPSGPAA